MEVKSELQNIGLENALLRLDSGDGHGISNGGVHRDLRKIHFPLETDEGEPRYIEMSLKDFAKLDAEDRVLLGLLMTNSTRIQDQEKYHMAWLYRICNKQVDDERIIAIDELPSIINNLTDKGVINGDSATFEPTQIGGEYLKDMFFSAKPKHQKKQKPIKSYRDLKPNHHEGIREEMDKTVFFEYVADTIAQRSGGDMRGWLLPRDNMTRVVLSLARELLSDEVVETYANLGDQDSQQMEETLTRWIEILDTTHGLLYRHKQDIDGQKGAIVNLQLTERGRKWYIKHIAFDLSSA